MERKKREGPIWKFCFWATLVCSSFAGSNGVGGHLENQGKHAGGSQAIWNRFRPSRLLHSMNLPFPPHLLTICAHTHIHTYTHTHTWTFRKNTCDRAFGWLFGETTTKKNFEAHSLTFYILTSICFFSSSIHRQHFPFTFFFPLPTVSVFFLPLFLYFHFESRFRPPSLLITFPPPYSHLPCFYGCFFFYYYFLIPDLYSNLTFAMTEEARWSVCVCACLFLPNQKQNKQKRTMCVCVCLSSLSLSLPNICSQTYSVLMS